ncbi:MAG TPA: radical SAM protein [Dissulfurispiraceae bacterium]|nr:radical SAM protein [Dissulfurispiraceae bacterium]
MPVTLAHEFFIQLHLTERCNLRCTHCYQEGTCSQEMSFGEVRGLVSEVSEMISEWEDSYALRFSRSFNVTGGEPLLRPDLFDILEEIASHGFSLFVLSNGTLVSDQAARMLAEAGVEGVQVSIEGPEAVHDAVRGSGSFLSAIRGIGSLLKAKVPVSLNVTLSEFNAARFPEVVELAKSLGIPKVGFSRLVPSGRGLAMVNDSLRPERLRTIYSELLSIDVPGIEIVTGDPIASQVGSTTDLTDCGAIPQGGCAAAVSGLTVLPDGTVTPCRRLAVPIGNIRHDSLRELWATSPVLESLRERRRYTGRCGACPRWARCRGCRAIAYAHSRMRGHGNFLSEDPQCFIEDAAHAS